MVPIFSNQNPDLGKFWRVLQWKILVFFMSILSTVHILGQNVVFYGHMVHACFGHLVYLSHFGMLHREKSGNTELHH
jgi:hypothetical protein